MRGKRRERATTEEREWKMRKENMEIQRRKDSQAYLLTYIQTDVSMHLLSWELFRAKISSAVCGLPTEL
jgi:hypothetical protein